MSHRGARSRFNHRTGSVAALETGATAIVAFNDLDVLGVLGVLGRLGVFGIWVPVDISVALRRHPGRLGFLWPPLTSVRLPPVDLGMRAWDVLQRRLSGQPPGEPVRRLP